MAEYEVWASNNVDEWTHCYFETDEREKAQTVADRLIETGQFRFAVIDRNGMTIWSNDPDTPAEGI